MSVLFRTSFGFAIAYVALMVPTYVLPWLGSNSVLVNAVGAAVGKGFTPQWWAHAWSLAMLILLAWRRGDLIGKGYLAAVAFIAAVFDLLPVLSAIPFVPSICHLVVLIGGVRGSVPEMAADDNGAVPPSAVPRLSGVAACVVTGIAVIGAATFIVSANQYKKAAVAQESTPAEKSGSGVATPAISPNAPSQVVVEKPVSEPVAGNETARPGDAPPVSAPKNPPGRAASSPPQVASKKTSEPSRVRYINIHE